MKKTTIKLWNKITYPIRAYRESTLEIKNLENLLKNLSYKSLLN